MTSSPPPWWQNPDPPTAATDGPPRPGTPTSGPHRARWLWVLAGLLVVIVVLLVAILLNQLRAPSTAPAPPEGATIEPAAPAGPTPTVPVTVDGYRYSVGISTFTPVVQAPTRSAPPGRHFLIATLVVRNDQSDRSAPALLATGAAPFISVGLTPVASLPPVHALGIAGLASDCDNDPRNAHVFLNPDPLYRGLPAQTCIVRTDVSPTDPGTSFEDDSTMSPGALTYGVVRTIDLPDEVATPQVGAWLATTSNASPQGSYAVLDPIPPTP